VWWAITAAANGVTMVAYVRPREHRSLRRAHDGRRDLVLGLRGRFPALVQGAAVDPPDVASALCTVPELTPDPADGPPMATPVSR
jgi:hypothetical protein